MKKKVLIVLSYVLVAALACGATLFFVSASTDYNKLEDLAYGGGGRIPADELAKLRPGTYRSEEPRGGEEWRSRGSPYH